MDTVSAFRSQTDKDLEDYVQKKYKVEWNICHRLDVLGLFSSCGLWVLISPTRDETHAPAVEAWNLNPWTAREVPRFDVLNSVFNVVVQSLSRVQLFVTSWTAGFSVFHYLPVFGQIHDHWISNAIQPLPLLLLPSPPAFNLSQHQGLFQWVCSSPKYWSFSFSFSPSNEYSGLISVRIDWFDLLAVQRTLKSPLKHHNLKPSILWHAAFLMVQLSHSYKYWKNHTLTRQTFAGKVMSLFFNML